MLKHTLFVHSPSVLLGHHQHQTHKVGMQRSLKVEEEKMEFVDNDLILCVCAMYVSSSKSHAESLPQTT